MDLVYGVRVAERGKAGLRETMDGAGMRTTIERLRAGVLVGAGLLVLVVAGFLSLARMRSHRLLRNLPEHLGAEIQKETNGFTLSQSVKGRTVFTLHASRATQMKDGQALLHDVGIVLYGEKDGRADRIYGREFTYDQKAGLVQAAGQVQLDLQAPAPTSATERAAYAAGGTAPRGAAPGKRDQQQPVHVTTTGLVYSQGTGVASTEGPIQFQYDGMTGQAVGARFGAKSGTTTLERAVRISGLRDGRPVVLTASHAELDRANRVLQLQTAHYVGLPAGASAATGQQTLSAGNLTMLLTADGAVTAAEARDGVELANAGGTMRAPRATLQLSSQGRPVLAHMTDGVEFTRSTKDTAAGEGTQGRADESEAVFDSAGQMRQLRMTGHAQVRMAGMTPRVMQAREVDLRLVGGGGQPAWVDQVTASGGAEVQSEEVDRKTGKAVKQRLTGDVLVAHLERSTAGVVSLRSVDGTGHTAVERTAPGLEESSRSATVEARFAPGTKGAEVVSAVQRGGVVVERTITGKDGAATRTEATSAEAAYDEASGRETLTGGVAVQEAGSVLHAQQVVTAGETGDAEATGGVEVVYRGSGRGSGTGSAAGGGAGGSASARPRAGAAGEGAPVYVAAARAEFRRSDGVATFFGGGGRPRARLWQGGSQVEAPVLVFGQKAGTLDARGDGASEGGGMPVRTVLGREVRPGAAGATGEATAAKPTGARHATGDGVTLVKSGRLHYVEAQHQAEFAGGVMLENAAGVMESRDAVATLRAAGGTAESSGPQGNGRAQGGAPAEPGGGGAMFGNGVERVVATGGVTLREPGRTATGEQLVYTGADGTFVLTGTPAVPPKVVDVASGAVSGAVLRFRSGDSSVVVEGRPKDGSPVSGDGRVHTETRVRP